MSEVTVCMPLIRSAGILPGSSNHSDGHFPDAIESILRQEGVDFELIVVAPEKIELPPDPRILQVVAAGTYPAAAYAAAFRHSTAPFFAIAGSNDLLLGGALRQMLDRCKTSAETGMTHCWYFLIDQAGRMRRDHYRNLRDSFLDQNEPDFDLKRELIVRGHFLSYFRIFRREALQLCGGFEEKWPDPDFAIALKIMHRFEIRSLPQFLYSKRHISVTRWKRLQRWFARASTVARLRKNGQELSEWNYGIMLWLILTGFWQALNMQEPIRKILRRLRSVLRPKTYFGPIFDFFYYAILRHLSWWRIQWIGSKQQNRVKDKTIVYYLWHFPVISQTFIHRELAALKKLGVPVAIVAETPENHKKADANASVLLKDVRYTFPMDASRLSRFRRFFWLKKPLVCLNILLFFMTHRHSRFKSFEKDRKVFNKALLLGGMLSNEKIGHIHAPWGDETAMVALVASRLLKTGFSFQVRAHELYREFYQLGLREKLTSADFVITNTIYNERHLESVYHSDVTGKLFRIYNGLDLKEFCPPQRAQHNPVRILCTARLIEQKGIEYLLLSCKELINEGYRFRCVIVGGPEESLYVNYFLMLKKMHRQLELGDCVDFSGECAFEKVLDYYRNADIFVLPCVIASDGSRDIIPNVVLEAMAMKLPVVSTSIGGIPEMIENEVSGILVAPNEVASLTKAIKRLIENPGLRLSLGEAARQRVEEQFDIEKNIADFHRLFAGEN